MGHPNILSSKSENPTVPQRTRHGWGTRWVLLLSRLFCFGVPLLEVGVHFLKRIDVEIDHVAGGIITDADIAGEIGRKHHLSEIVFGAEEGRGEIEPAIGREDAEM